MAQSITAAQIQQIASSSNAVAVLSAFSSLGPIANYTDLLDTTTPANDAVCLASEQIIHMTESWRYLSSAMYAFLNHETGNATHLAYYAELRAALSLYSGSGIRIKFRDAYWLDQAASRNNIPKHKTHDLVWQLWPLWTKRPDAKALLEDNIRFDATVSLKDFEGSLKQHSSGLLLSQWGYDLVNLSDDHLARNVASYQAYWRDKSLTKMKADDLDFVKSLSELFLDSGVGLAFDQALIQYAVHATVESVLDHSDPASHEAVRVKKLDEIAAFVAKQSGADKDSLLSKLGTNEGKKIFDNAVMQTSSVECVMSRAAFLARLSMLFVKKNISSSGNGHAKSWLMNWLEHCGAWDSSGNTDVNDIHTDFQEALQVFSRSHTLLPADLWKRENAFYTNQVASLHTCIAWGAFT